MYTLNATFDAHVDQEETLAAVLEALPEGTKASLELEPVLLDVTDLGDEHVGSSIRAHIGTGAEFGGVLTAVAPNFGGGMMVIVDGKSHILGSWDTVQVIPPVTVGEHTPDEPEAAPEAVDEFNLSPDDYNQAVELAVRAEIALENHLLPLGWLSRVAIEAVAGRVVTDEEFRLISIHVRDMFTPMLETFAVPAIARVVQVVDTYKTEGEGKDA